MGGRCCVATSCDLCPAPQVTSGFPAGSGVKNPPAVQETWVGSLGGKIPGGGNGSPLQCSCLENPMHERVWQAAVHGVAKPWTGLSD